MCRGRKWEAAQGRNRGQETKIGEPGEKVTEISFNSDSVMDVENDTGTATQTEDFDYLFHTSTAKSPFDETYFANDNQGEGEILHWVACLWRPANSFTVCFEILCKEVANFVPISRICHHSNET